MVTAEAAAARKPKARRRKRSVLASRRSTKERSCTRTTNPIGWPPSNTGMALTWALPPGSETTLCQGRHFVPVSSEVERTCLPTSRQSNCTG
jgi:hypothetical protein